ncbi:DUF2269 family protein [Paenibacillus flagellatus]|uniref:DUF2269 domain-containing protein n=1 Tax=Paenibacillus flagellatus TaxID=2211139 RepID=A0A2V5JYE8_9BACL|nr:DUF2269 family protein [Paenibacillus flagellatus]PYI50294.1 hypothetical protein DLM86_29945 [Paenibacillus flagellatus]
MEWLVLLHVLSAIIGLGPAYAFPLLLRPTTSVEEMERSLRQVARLELFPKISGTLAVLSGIVLFWIGSYGSLLQLWIGGTLVLYILIEVLIVGFLAPALKKLQAALSSPDARTRPEAPAPLAAMYAKVRNLHLWATVLGTIIFILMILKPH